MIKIKVKIRESKDNEYAERWANKVLELEQQRKIMDEWYADAINRGVKFVTYDDQDKN